MEVKDIINEGRPAEIKGEFTFEELAAELAEYNYKSGVHDGYEYALEEFENNRLKACDAQTEAESERELNFAIKFFREHHRQPTFSDAIEITRKQMIGKAIEWIRTNIRPYYSDVKYKYNDFRKAMEE